MDSVGTIYVLDYGNLRVQKWLKGAKSGITVAGGNGRGSAPNQFNEPSGIYVDNVGNIYVADRFNNRIQKFIPGSTNGITVALTVAPHSVFVDKKGSIYADDNGISIKRFNPNDLNGKIVAEAEMLAQVIKTLRFPAVGGRNCREFSNNLEKSQFFKYFRNFESGDYSHLGRQ